MHYCIINYLQVICYIILMQYESAAEKFTYISTEHPKVISFNPKYLSFANLTSRRYGRNDPFYYVDLHFNALVYFGNNLTIDFYFYEWLTNQYKRGFVEMHFKACDLIHNDKFFGSALKQGKFAQSCPYPPIDFYFYEWLTNQYKRGFVEMHFKACDLIHNDKFFGSALKQGKFAQSCPYPPDEYHLYNMTIPVKHIPPHFPFRKGRIYANFTTDGNEFVACGYIDMEIKEFTTRKMKN